MPAISVINGNTAQIHSETGVFNVPLEVYNEIRGGSIVPDDVVLRPSAVINYLRESNPLLMETEIQVEKEKVRRKMQGDSIQFIKWGALIGIVLICAALAYVMITQGGAAVETVANTASTASSGLAIK